MEGTLTYMKGQITKLWANQNAQPYSLFPAGNLLLPQSPDNSQQSTLPFPATLSDATTAGGSKKTVVVLDLSIFKRKINMKEKNISYDYWLLQMKNKMTVNKKIMLIKTLKKLYVQSWVSNNAPAQLKPCFWEDTIKPFATSNKMFKTLTSAFGNFNQK